MPRLESVRPQPALRPYVRAYAQRNFDATDSAIVEPVPAQLEQVLNFELGIQPGVDHRQCRIADKVWIGGAQISFPGYMRLSPGVESFAVFFEPHGWSSLFAIPVREITNHIYDATSILGVRIISLWNELKEAALFERRVVIVEEFLLRYANRDVLSNRFVKAATCIFRQHGIISIQDLCRQNSLGLRQFERLFREEIGVSPKSFARGARFQAALDAKLVNPQRTWLDIAHRFGYFDQMHMVHDFQDLGSHSPRKLVVEMGDVRPPALASAA